MFTIRAPNRAHSGISAGVRFTAGVGHTDNPAALAYFRKAGYTIEIVPSKSEPILAALPAAPQEGDVPRGTSEAEEAAGSPSPFAPGAPVAPAGKPLERMNKAELQAIAAELSLDLEGANRELVERIRAKRAEG